MVTCSNFLSAEKSSKFLLVLAEQHINATKTSDKLKNPPYWQKEEFLRFSQFLDLQIVFLLGSPFQSSELPVALHSTCETLLSRTVSRTSWLCALHSRSISQRTRYNDNITAATHHCRKHTELWGNSRWFWGSPADSAHSVTPPRC